MSHAQQYLAVQSLQPVDKRYEALGDLDRALSKQVGEMYRSDVQSSWMNRGEGGAFLASVAVVAGGVMTGGVLLGVSAAVGAVVGVFAGALAVTPEPVQDGISNFGRKAGAFFAKVLRADDCARYENEVRPEIVSIEKTIACIKQDMTQIEKNDLEALANSPKVYKLVDQNFSLHCAFMVACHSGPEDAPPTALQQKIASLYPGRG